MINNQIIIEDQNVRDAINESTGNVVISAPAGTGKTHTIITKIKRIINEQKSLKKILAITFTKKAANELVDRISTHDTNNFVVAITIDSWLLHEIIIPFIKNIYPQLDSSMIVPNYSNTEKPIKSYEEGITALKKTGMILRYPGKLDFRTTGTDSKFDRNGDNFISELALSILKSSAAARQYIKCTYGMIFIDEYQDINKSQNEVFLYMIDTLKIRAFIVGDADQELYFFRGANPKYLRNFVLRKDFQNFVLTHNFRSDPSLIKYTKNFSTNYQHQKWVEKQNNGAVSLLNCTDGDDPFSILSSQVSVLVSNVKTCNDSIMVLCLQNNSLNYIKENYKETFNDFALSRPVCYSNSVNAPILSIIIKIFFDDRSIYDLAPYIDYEIIHSTFNSLQKIKNQYKYKDDRNNSKLIIKFLDLINTNLTQEITTQDYQNLLETINNPDQLNLVLGNKSTLNLLTIHGSKGLEADHVFIFGRDFIQNGVDITRKELHYVAITRAIHHLYIIDNNNMYRTAVKNVAEFK